MRIGPHIDRIYSNKKKALLFDHIKEAIKYTKDCANFDITAVAIFVAGPRTYSINVDNNEAELIRSLNLDIFVHNTYISHPWSNKPSAIHSIRKQLSICNTMNAIGFIIHLPKDTTDTIINILPKIYDPSYSTRIYLETPALKPSNAIFHKPDKLNELFNRIKNEIDPNLNYFGLCIDTAHLWSCGIDLSDYKSAETWFHELNINPECLMIHLNDNDKELGSAPDVHNSLTDGKIWNRYKDNLHNSGLMFILLYAKKYNIPVILERHSMDLLFNDYVIIQQLI
jgi:endonuclease IV